MGQNISSDRLQNIDLLALRIKRRQSQENMERVHRALSEKAAAAHDDLMTYAIGRKQTQDNMDRVHRALSARPRLRRSVH